MNWFEQHKVWHSLPQNKDPKVNASSSKHFAVLVFKKTHNFLDKNKDMQNKDHKLVGTSGF